MPRRASRPGSGALMIYAASEHDSNLYYAVKFSVPDPFPYFRIGNKDIILMSDLELGRAQKQAQVDEVLSYSEAQMAAKGQGIERPGVADVSAHFLKSRGVRKVTVPDNFNLGLADALRQRGIQVVPKADPFFEQRVLKSEEEVRMITRSLRHTEAAIHKLEDLLRRSRIVGKRLSYRGTLVTSELLKKVLNVSMMENNCIGSHTIVASGNQGCDPHQEGTGPVWAHQSLIVDVFPRSADTFYYADITRTFVKGKASPQLKRQYEAVRHAQELGIKKVAPGVNGREVHQAIQKDMESRGYRTEKRKGTMVGFFHGTGHGLGLDVHEPPRVNASDHVLRPGEVVTVEPGLYYPGVGAVRIEDLLVVTPKGHRNLTVYPKKLEIP
ncbi:MAG TPA: Xaa-Pro peptidase family protein [bacterium]|nr:Xaa-Pro peptidase family protein [bacterium]